VVAKEQTEAQHHDLVATVSWQKPAARAPYANSCYDPDFHDGRALWAAVIICVIDLRDTEPVAWPGFQTIRSKGLMMRMLKS